MTEREQIVNGLLDVVEDISPFAGNHEDWKKVHRAIKYLNESVKPEVYFVSEERQKFYRCSGCKMAWYHKHKYCPECGREVKWDTDKIINVRRERAE